MKASLRNALPRPVKPREEPVSIVVWCEPCGYMHPIGACACRHDYRDGDVCSLCDQSRTR